MHSLKHAGFILCVCFLGLPLNEVASQWWPCIELVELVSGENVWKVDLVLEVDQGGCEEYSLEIKLFEHLRV